MQNSILNRLVIFSGQVDHQKIALHPEILVFPHFFAKYSASGFTILSACNVKYVRIDEFSALKFDTIKPKLYEKESPDELNNEKVPPIIVRVDIPKVESKPPRNITLLIQDRVLTLTSHTIDILSQNCKEIFTPEEKLQQIELLRHEDEQLRSELNVHKTEISVLRVERDSLMNTITKLDNGLTDAENHRITQ